jgi:hypothetical protein
MPQNPQIGSDPNIHFNLGVDSLASTDEITDMHDPWLATAEPTPPAHVEAGVHMPEGDFAPLSDPRQLPGV